MQKIISVKQTDIKAVIDLRTVPIHDIERIIDDLETKIHAETEIASGFEQSGNIVLSIKHTAKSHAYNYAVGELKKLQ